MRQNNSGKSKDRYLLEIDTEGCMWEKFNKSVNLRKGNMVMFSRALITKEAMEKVKKYPIVGEAGIIQGTREYTKDNGGGEGVVYEIINRDKEIHYCHAEAICEVAI